MVIDKKDILVCGHRSFVATGMLDKLQKANVSFDTFSRGEQKREGSSVTGDVLKMHENKYLGDYTCVINFVILKGLSVEDNILYIQSLLDFCMQKHVKRLIPK